jgi:hypothetical protein
VKFFHGTVRSDESSEKSYAINFPRFDLCSSSPTSLYCVSLLSFAPKRRANRTK